MKPAGIASIFALTISALIAHSAPASTQTPITDPRDIQHCELKAVHPADNDIHFGEDRRFKSVPARMPPSVSRVILDHVYEVAKDRLATELSFGSELTCTDIFSSVFLLNGPAGLQLYVVPREHLGPGSGRVDYFLVYDPRPGAVTKSPPLIYAEWFEGFGAHDPLIKRPIVRMEPAHDGRPPLLVVQERAHNGTVYNAAVYRYFEIGEDMSLTQVLAVEARAKIFDHAIERRATFLGPDRVRIDVSSRSQKEGSVLLERAQGERVFRIVREIPAPGGLNQGLLTFCVTAEGADDFLRNGCDFYY